MQLTTYSVSLSVSCSGVDELLNNGPNTAKSGIAANCSKTKKEDLLTTYKIMKTEV